MERGVYYAYVPVFMECNAKEKHLMIKAITLAISTTLALSATPAFAGGTKAPGTGPNPFTDCGIGAALFKDTDWAAVSSNTIWDLGTTAITSATMSPETCSARKVETAQFILDSYENLVEETAFGQGDHLTAVMNTFGCPAGDHSSIAASVREQMGKVVSDDSYSSLNSIERATEYYQALGSAAADRCSA